MPLDSVTTEIAATASRRGLLRGVGIGAAALGAATMGFARSADAQAAITDEDILNFALNLEYLEAEFYLNAVNGTGLPPSAIQGVGPTGAVSGGGTKVPFATNFIAEYAAEIANDEMKHVLFLRKALGKAAVARPAINLGTSFVGVGVASGAYPASGAPFNPFASEQEFLLGSFVFEDVGVTAYHGAAASITSKAYLTAAAGILAVEAYHAAEVRLLIIQQGTPLSIKANQISHLRTLLSGTPDDQGVIYSNVPNVVPTDGNSLAYARTPNQVLNVVYGGGAANNYLFFPDKLNGAIA